VRGYAPTLAIGMVRVDDVPAKFGGRAHHAYRII
jgi:hypothetical protein